MKKLLALLVAFTIATPQLFADEGMWMLPFLKQQNLAKMQKMGLKLSAEDIYAPGNGSIVDAVVQFGGGCTGEIVSANGLVFTNHHCGFGQIQNHSSVDHNYIRDGFYAPTLADELPNPGLTVTQITEISDVTDYVQAYLKEKGMNDPLVYLRRSYLQDIAVAWYKETHGEMKNGTELDLAPFYEGNKFYIFVQKVYSDIRLVAAPPKCVGSYGADTDNWTWPRHSGDFSVFRIYTAPNGEPAKYSEENIPFRPKHHLKINVSGVKEDDFVMIMGFPGTTNHFYTPDEVAERRDVDNQIQIDLRNVRQTTMMKEMLADEAVNIQYASKYQGSTNKYKNSIGTNWAINKMKFEEQKQAEVDKLVAYAKANNKPEYIEAVQQISNIISERAPLRRLQKVLDEGIWRAMEIVKAPLLTSGEYDKLKNNPDELDKWLTEKYEGYFDKDYNEMVDRKVTKAMLQAVLDSGVQTELFAGVSDADTYVDNLFDSTIYKDKATLKAFIQNNSFMNYLQDPLVSVASAIREEIKQTKEKVASYDRDFQIARQTYVKGIMEMEGEMNLWPDANLTLRYSFGKVKGYTPRDNVYYGHQTTMEGVMEKHDPTNPEYQLQPRIIEIYQNKEFGDYALPNGQMPIDMCATTHTTGGNSGSPVINANGELVGLNFDRNWEGVGGDIIYLPDYQRSIIADTRYVLLILDKYLGADRIIKELSITH
ncbi:S46 family peptidase [Porphyromonadaceae bacterium W3.11]|nr:S46 family peptidase [Porphyromonadaceae bacterium W3.11]